MFCTRIFWSGTKILWSGTNLFGFGTNFFGFGTNFLGSGTQKFEKDPKQYIFLQEFFVIGANFEKRVPRNLDPVPKF